MLLSALPLLAALATAQAQTPAAAPEGPAASAERRVQRVVVQDGGSRIEEVRYGGETQSISVSTPGAMPPYEVVPAHGARQRPAGQRDGAPGSTGMRVWTLGAF